MPIRCSSSTFCLHAPSDREVTPYQGNTSHLWTTLNWIHSILSDSLVTCPLTVFQVTNREGGSSNPGYLAPESVFGMPRQTHGFFWPPLWPFHEVFSLATTKWSCKNASPPIWFTLVLCMRPAHRTLNNLESHGEKSLPLFSCLPPVLGFQQGDSLHWCQWVFSNFLKTVHLCF